MWWALCVFACTDLPLSHPPASFESRGTANTCEKTQHLRVDCCSQVAASAPVAKQRP